MSVIILSVISGVLAAASMLFAYLYFTLRHKIKENPDHATQLILSDIFAGTALIRVERVAPENIYLRRPQ